MNYWETPFTAGMFLLSVYNPFWGMCGLLCWIILGDKIAAHVGMTLFHIPIFVTEAVMCGMLLSFLYDGIRRKKTSEPAPPGAPHGVIWILFYANGLLSALRGFFAYGPVRVIRDSALLYYSLFTHMTIRLLRSKERLRTFGILIGYAILLKMIISIVDSTLKGGFFAFQSGATSIYIGCLLIMSLALMPLWRPKHVWWSAICVIAFSELIQWQTRSSWTGFFAFVLFWLASASYLKVRFRQIAWGGGLLLLGLAFHVVFDFYVVPGVDRWIYWHTPPPQTVVQAPAQTVTELTPLPTPPAQVRETTPVSSTAVMAPSPAAPQPGNPGQQVDMAVPSSAPVTPALTTVPVTPEPPAQKPGRRHRKAARAALPPDRVPMEARPEVRKFISLFQGDKSPNVSTRICLWLDAIEEVFNIQFSYSSENWKDPHFMYRQEREEMEQRIGPFVFDNEIENPAGYRLVNNRLLRALNGIPFGKNFLPPRMFWRMWETARYDPHNSHIAILYRTGVIGFSLYLFLVVSGFIRGFRFARHTSDEEGRLLMIGVLGCLLFHFVHTMTDVTLENSYKGILFWVILGLVDVVRRLYPA